MDEQSRHTQKNLYASGNFNMFALTCQKMHFLFIL